MQQDPFGEKIITITAKNLNQTQINSFYNRMRKIELSGSYGMVHVRLYVSPQTIFLRSCLSQFLYTFDFFSKPNF